MINVHKDVWFTSDGGVGSGKNKTTAPFGSTCREDIATDCGDL